jgi:hypothetical protein
MGFLKLLCTGWEVRAEGDDSDLLHNIWGLGGEAL